MYRKGIQGVRNQVHLVMRTRDKAGADSLSRKGLLELELPQTIRRSDRKTLFTYCHS